MTALPLAGKVALITGASKGIGRAIALRLARDGASVVINYSSNTASAEAVVNEIGADRAIAVQADVGSLPEIEKLVQATVERFGKIDILVPNAGIISMLSFQDTTEEIFDRSFAANTKGPFFLAQKAVPHMPRGSHIVFLSTTQNYSSTVSPPYLLYCATKGAIDQITRVLAKELAPKGIAVNGVAPGPIETDGFRAGKSEELVKMIARFSPVGRIGEPEEVADAVRFLVGEESRWVLGQVVRVNGGII